MPLSEEEQRRVRARLGAATASGLPAEIAQIAAQMPPATPYVGSANVRGVRVNVPKPQSEVQRELLVEQAKQKLKALNPVPTESERERGRLERRAVSFLDSFEKKLGVNRRAGQVANERLMTPARTFVPQGLQEYVMKDEEISAYNDLDSAFSVGVIALTGRQGDVEKLRQLQNIYSFGSGMRGKPTAVINKLQNLRRLFSTIEDQRSSNDDISAQMDTLLEDEQDRIAVIDSRGQRFTIPRRQAALAQSKGYQLLNAAQ